MIPKIIHYCWFGGNPLPDLAIHCMNSWKKYLSEYEIIEWNETNIDLSANSYIQEAYEKKKWAFITDYVRLKVMYEYGGIYMDTDVEVLKSLDGFLKEEAFSGFEDDNYIPTGIMASVKGQRFIGELLTYYDNVHFINNDGTLNTLTNVRIITEYALKHGFVANNEKQTIQGMTFYPRDFFCPKDRNDGRVYITSNSACIHHFNGSWLSQERREEETMKQVCRRRFGKNLGTVVYKSWKYLLHPRKLIRRIVRGESSPNA